MFGFTKKFITAIAMILAIFMLAAAPAGAINDDFLPGGNGPDTEPFDINVSIGVLVVPTASVEVSCANETATARIENPTGNFHPFAVRVDGDLVDSGTTVPNGASPVSFPLSENETVAVEIEVGGDVLIDQEFTRDCLLPDPSYDLLEDCESGQAHARLVNNGDDVARMGIDYGGVPVVLQSVAPHSSIDWLLAVDPGESVDFTVKFGDVDLGTESIAFSCPEEPTTTTTPPETPETGTETETETETEPETETETPVILIEDPFEGSATGSVQEPVNDVEEVTSGNAEPVEDITDEDITDEVDIEDDEELAFAAASETDDDRTDRDSSGSSFGKVAFIGFSLLLVLALAIALYAAREEIQTA